MDITPNEIINGLDKKVRDGIYKVLRLIEKAWPKEEGYE